MSSTSAITGDVEVEQQQQLEERSKLNNNLSQILQHPVDASNIKHKHVHDCMH